MLGSGVALKREGDEADGCLDEMVGNVIAFALAYAASVGLWAAQTPDEWWVLLAGVLSVTVFAVAAVRSRR